jgi:short-subunit dehydrogenase
MNLALVARNAEKLRSTAAVIAAEHGVETVAIPADLGRQDVLDPLLAGLDGREIGFMVYNCAAEHGGEFLALDVERHLNTIQVNCISPTILLHHFGKQMVQRHRGGMVICSSASAFQGTYFWGSYAGSKAYEMILGETLWYELKDHGVNVASLMLGATDTPNFKRMLGEEGDRSFEDFASFPAPQEPADASAVFFAQIDQAWLPQMFANPKDEEAMKAATAVPKAELIAMAGDQMREIYKRKRVASGA